MSVFMKKAISFLLVMSMLVSLAVPVYADSPGTGETSIVSNEGFKERQTKNNTPLFTASEIEEALGEDKDSALTISQLREEYEFTQEFKEGMSSETATTADVLDAFILKHKSRFIGKKDGAYIYPAGDSIWLSADEWQGLMDRITEPCLLSTVRVLESRTEKTEKYIEEHHIYHNYEEFSDFVQSLFRDFSFLLPDNEEAVNFWMATEGFSADWDFSTVLHELLHETAAKRVKRFSGRKVEDKVWAVSLKGSVRKTVLWDTAKNDFVPVQIRPMPSTETLLSNTVPAAIRDLKLYDMYISQDASASAFAVYGMMEELDAVRAQIRAETIIASFQIPYTREIHTDDPNAPVVLMNISDRTSVPLIMTRMYYWWRGCILHYMSELREKRLYIYKELIKDSEFIALIVDTLNEVDEQLALAPALQGPFVVTTGTSMEEVELLQSWATDETAEYQMKLLTACVTNA